MAMTSASFMGIGGFSSALLTKLDKIDCSQILSAVLLADKELLGHIKEGPPAANIECNWIEDELVGQQFNAIIISSTAVSVVGLGTSASLERLVRTKSVIQVSGSLGYAQVVSTTGASLITVAAYSSTSFTTGTATLIFTVIGSPYSDLDSASSDISQARTKRRNFTQVFERAIEITQTRQGMDMEAVVSELQLQTKYRTYEIKRELDVAVISGIASWDGSYKTATTEWRTMQGIINYIRDYDMDNTAEDTLVTNVAGALTIANLNDAIYGIWNAGGLDDMSDPIIAVGARQQRVLASFEKELRRVEQGERQIGYYRDIFLSDMGKEFPIVLDRWIPADMLIVLDRARLSLRSLQGDAWHLEKMAKTGRSEKWQLSGQYTIEVRNADKCHALLYGLS